MDALPPKPLHTFLPLGLFTFGFTGAEVVVAAFVIFSVVAGSLVVFGFSGVVDKMGCFVVASSIFSVVADSLVVFGFSEVVDKIYCFVVASSIFSVDFTA